jgi:hypothetical protein
VRPERIRRIGRGFAFIPNRFLHGGFFASLAHLERSLYLFLVLAADRHGVSYYGLERICATLNVTPAELIVARDALIHKDLVAFDGTCFQVLSLPAQPVARTRPPLARPRSQRPTQEELEAHDPATIRRLIRASLDER